MTSERKDEYNSQASLYQGARVQALQEELDYHALVAGQAADNICKGNQHEFSEPTKIMMCKLTHSEVESLSADVQSVLDRGRGGKQIASKSQCKIESPEPFAQSVFEDLVKLSPLADVPTEAAGEVWTRVAKLRRVFSRAVFVVEPGSEHPSCFRFVFAGLNPVHVSLLPVCRILVETIPPSLAEFQAGKNIPPQFVFTFEPGSFVNAATLERVDAQNIGVLLDTRFKGSQLLFSWDHIVPLEFAFTELDNGEIGRQHCERTQSADGEKGEVRTSSVPDWADTLLKKDFSASTRGQGSTQRADAGQESDSDASSVDEDDAAELLHRALEARRAEQVFPDVATIQEQFRTNVIGGTWSVQRSGRGVYGMRCDVKRGSRIGVMCAQFVMGFSVSFSENLFTAAEGEALAKLWMARLAFLEVIWHRAGSPAVFPDIETEFVVPAELSAACASMVGRAHKRREEIMRLCP
eukprot:6461570-Amphidinium_carterae.3